MIQATKYLLNILFILGALASVQAAKILPRLHIPSSCDTIPFQKQLRIPIRNLGLFDNNIDILSVTCSFDWASPTYPKTLGYREHDSILLQLANDIQFYQPTKIGTLTIRTNEKNKPNTYTISISIKPIDKTGNIELKITPQKVNYLSNLKVTRDTIILGQGVIVTGTGYVFCNLGGGYSCNPHYRLQIELHQGQQLLFEDVYPYSENNVRAISGFWGVREVDGIQLSFTDFERVQSIYGEELEDIKWVSPAIFALQTKNTIQNQPYARLRFLILGIDDEWYSTNIFTVKLNNEK